jgi:hypothetical protein
MCYNMMQLCINVVVVYCTDPHLSDIVQDVVLGGGLSFIMDNTLNHCRLVIRPLYVRTNICDYRAADVVAYSAAVWQYAVHYQQTDLHFPRW